MNGHLCEVAAEIFDRPVFLQSSLLYRRDTCNCLKAPRLFGYNIRRGWMAWRDAKRHKIIILSNLKCCIQQVVEQIAITNEMIGWQDRIVACGSRFCKTAAASPTTDAVPRGEGSII